MDLGESVPSDPRFIDKTGVRYHYLTVLFYVGLKNQIHMWRCLCDCGEMRTVSGPNLASGHTKSCGCLSRSKSAARFFKHGLISLPEYSVWSGIKRRCTDPKYASYPRYGGRGIKVCERWNSFEAFYNDMGTRPSNFEIDRINNDGDYSPENCRWVSHTENLRNMRNNVIWEFDGKRLCVAAWSECTGIKSGTLRRRVETYGWSIERALTSPVNHDTKFRRGESKNEHRIRCSKSKG